MPENQSLKDYVAQRLGQGVSVDKLKSELNRVGWPENDILAALAISTPPEPPVPTPPMPPVPNVSTGGRVSGNIGMWDTFEHVLLFVSLLVFAVIFTQTLHVFINKWYPNTTVDQYSVGYYVDTFQATLLRWYLATLIVAYPLFAYFFLDISKRTRLNPSIRGLKSRKTLIYLTLIITFLIMIGEIINTVFNLLSGNISLNFVLHFTVTVVVTGIIFAYYLFQVREDRKINDVII
jgi:hypothetical protein